ncbi:hypothetical protein H6792_02895 [Candidatus Nomurabacteria bacterium]|nr:hypothetical protein [Candidatus Nomurabacteria bacterium]
MISLNPASQSRLSLISNNAISSYIISGLENQDLSEIAQYLATKWGINPSSINTINPDTDKLKISLNQIKQFKAHRQHRAVNTELTIVEQPEKLSLEASNALLKELEEPGANKYILFLSKNPYRLLSTIRSRLPLVSLGYQTLINPKTSYLSTSTLGRLKLIEQYSSRPKLEALLISLSSELSLSINDELLSSSQQLDNWYRVLLSTIQDMTINLNIKLLLTKLSIIKELR